MCNKSDLRRLYNTEVKAFISSLKVDGSKVGRENICQDKLINIHKVIDGRVSTRRRALHST